MFGGCIIDGGDGRAVAPQPSPPPISSIEAPTSGTNQENVTMVTSLIETITDRNMVQVGGLSPSSAIFSIWLVFSNIRSQHLAL